MPQITLVPPGAQPRSGNPQLPGNLAQRPAAARRQPTASSLNSSVYWRRDVPIKHHSAPQELIRGVYHFEGGSVWPELRVVWVLLVAIVVIGLIGANYHFVSDIIGGLYLGVAIGLGIAGLMLSPSDCLVSTRRSC
jgi:hypothetical protein